MAAIPSKQDNPGGLHRRYTVTKADGTPCDPDAIYFVLRLDNAGFDVSHIAACRAAARCYACEILARPEAAHLAQTARELLALLDGAVPDMNWAFGLH
jgi:ferredoxin